jgi:hypothetical protein
LLKDSQYVGGESHFTARDDSEINFNRTLEHDPALVLTACCRRLDVGDPPLSQGLQPLRRGQVASRVCRRKQNVHVGPFIRWVINGTRP